MDPIDTDPTADFELAFSEDSANSSTYFDVDPSESFGPATNRPASGPPIDCDEWFHNLTIQMDVNITRIKRDMYSVAVPVYIVICVIVMIANGTVLYAARAIKNTTKEHPTLPLTLSLAVADLWTSIVMAVGFVYNSYLFFVFGIPSNACLAQALEAVRMGGLITGSLHLLALAIIHYLTIRYPTSYQTFVTAKSNWVVVVLIWLVPPVSLFVFMSSLPGQFFRSPYVQCRGYCTAIGLWHTLEFRLVIFFAFFSPFILMSFLYFMFLILFRRQEKKFTRGPSGGVPNSNSRDELKAVSTLRRTSSLKKQKCQRQQLQKSRRTFTTTLLIWFTFMLGWMPACSLFVLTCATCPLPFPRETIDNVRAVFILSAISNLFILCKSLINPIVYAVRIPEIKLAMAKRYGWCWRFVSRRPAAAAATNHSTTGGCTLRKRMMMMSTIDHDEEDDEKNGKPITTDTAPAATSAVRNRKATTKAEGQESGSDARDCGDTAVESPLRSPQERDNLLRNNNNGDCEMYENRNALEKEEHHDEPNKDDVPSNGKTPSDRH